MDITPAGFASAEVARLASNTVHAASPGGSSPAIIVGVMVVVLTMVGALIWVLVVFRQRRLVFDSSAALKQLDELNSRFQLRVEPQAPITVDFPTRVDSKTKFDRFDLAGHMDRSVLEYQKWFEQEIRSRVDATQHFRIYHHDFEMLAFMELGKSTHARINAERFAAIENKAFHRRKLANPLPTAVVSSTVRYTSPQGKNSYSSRLTWNFDQLRVGLSGAQTTRERQSTAEALRQHERSLMRPGLRTKVLKRDNFRCRMCGASAAEGVTLHVDHITPVSRGGRTTPENLQTLCASCNLGKSNRFVG